MGKRSLGSYLTEDDLDLGTSFIMADANYKIKKATIQPTIKDQGQTALRISNKS